MKNDMNLRLSVACVYIRWSNNRVECVLVKRALK